MTTVNIPISDLAKQRLVRRASEQGVPLEELARTILEREADETPAQPSIDNWISQWRQWAASHPQRDVRLDDSRESIYEGRGE